MNHGGLTLAYSSPAFGMATLELVQGVHGRQYLDGACGIEHVSIVAWGSSKPSTIMLAREDKFNGLLSW